MNKKVYINDFSISFPKKKENNSLILKLAKKKTNRNQSYD